jgi:hypothetical protein
MSQWWVRMIAVSRHRPCLFPPWITTPVPDGHVELRKYVADAVCGKLVRICLDFGGFLHG